MDNTLGTEVVDQAPSGDIRQPRPSDYVVISQNGRNIRMPISALVGVIQRMIASSASPMAHSHPESDVNSLEVDLAKRPIVYLGATQKNNSKAIFTSGVVSAGSVTFNLTVDGTAGGTALFANVYKESCNFWADDASAAFQFGSWTLSANKKTLTISANRSISTLLSLLGLNVLGAPTAANGVTIHAAIWGD